MAGDGPLVLGLDGCTRGWVCVALRDGRIERARTYPSLAAALAAFDGVATVGIDMPFALAAASRRRADADARLFVGRRASSVFAVPPAAALAALSHAEAIAIARAHGGPAPSAQCHALFPKMIEAATAFAAGAPLYEVHPEVSFRHLAGAPLASKRSWNGLRARLAALAAAGIDLPELEGDSAPADDVLDAAVVAWSAARIAAGEAATLPADPTQAERAANMLVWY